MQVREVFVKHRAAILGDDALGQHAQLAVMQVNPNPIPKPKPKPKPKVA